MAAAVHGTTNTDVVQVVHKVFGQSVQLHKGCIIRNAKHTCLTAFGSCAIMCCSYHWSCHFDVTTAADAQTNIVHC